ncbi:hypothetical protein [Pseudovibrio sp. SPO723]|uniref:hypothetical protein n=1 Tax=Nesiotobacter zosterae TaxID=392721 RepID=UPI0029C527D4|nr:hypothetical protein [Pseudovibrio sp. SPO723]MDX5592756.1 hypothetical protein [Pseudovibrio sp. SPO723]
MKRKMMLVSGFVLSWAAMTSGLQAADIAGEQPSHSPYRPCSDFKQQLPAGGQEQISITIRQFFDEANPVVLAGQRGQGGEQTFLWAQETRDWCGVAIGYEKEGYLDVEAINRCLCFRTFWSANRPLSQQNQMVLK